MVRTMDYSTYRYQSVRLLHFKIGLHMFFFLNIFWEDFFSFVPYNIQHCFICRPSDSTVPTDAGIEPRTVATGALAVRRSNHWARSHPFRPSYVFSGISGISLPGSRPCLLFSWGGKSKGDSRSRALFTIMVWYGEQYNNDLSMTT
jgi:hypothetical protein